jgi:hypothetical protein
MNVHWKKTLQMMIIMMMMLTVKFRQPGHEFTFGVG